MTRKIKLSAVLLSICLIASIIVGCTGTPQMTTGGKTGDIAAVNTDAPADTTDTSADTPTAEPGTEPGGKETTEPADKVTTEPAAETTSEPTENPTEEPAAEQTAEPTSEPTAAPTAAPTATPTTTPNDKILAAYIYRRYGSLKASDVEKLDIIYAAFGLVSDDYSSMEYDKEDRIYTLTNARKNHPSTRIVLSIGGWGADGFSQMARNDSRRAAFIASVMAFVDKYKLDGVDVDWEYPVSGGDIAHSDSDKANFTKLLRDLRAALDQRTSYTGGRMLLTIAASASGEYWWESIDTSAVIGYLDYVNLMTYDFAGDWSRRTGHHTALSAAMDDGWYAGECVKEAVQTAKQAGVPASKIIIGAASYGKLFSGVSGTSNNGLGREYYGGCEDVDLDDIKAMIRSGKLTRYWDDKAKAPYLFGNGQFVSYDDEQSVAEKANYIIKQKLAGMMFWEYYGDSESTIINTAYSTFTNR